MELFSIRIRRTFQLVSTIIYTITQDNSFKKLHAPAGKQTDINIDFHYTPPLITMDVLPWENIHQDTEL